MVQSIQQGSDLTLVLNALVLYKDLWGVEAGVQ